MKSKNNDILGTTENILHSGFFWGINWGSMSSEITNKIIFIFSYSDFWQIDGVVFLTTLLCFLSLYQVCMCLNLCAYMYVCICVYMYMYVYVCICVHVCRWVWVLMCVYVHVCVHSCAYMYVYFVCIGTHVPMCICILCIYTHMYMYTQYVYMYMFICICVCESICVCMYVCIFVCIFAFSKLIMCYIFIYLFIFWLCVIYLKINFIRLWIKGMFLSEFALIPSGKWGAGPQDLYHIVQ